MLKREERFNLNSCFNRAYQDENIFVLMGRDSVAPATIRFWANERVRLGQNERDDKQIQEALELAERMEDERPQIRSRMI